jgi:hypothetical protein
VQWLFTTFDSFTHNADLNRRVKLRVVIGGLVVSFVIAFWLLIDGHIIRTYQEHVALDRYGEPSLMEPPWEGPDLVVLYRTGRYGVVCFTALRSKELHDHLSGKNGQLVTVEYETFSNFGKVFGYRLHSVDGIAQANGGMAGAAGIISSKRADGSISGGESDCW